jgi:hypothetical protein
MACAALCPVHWCAGLNGSAVPGTVPRTCCKSPAGSAHCPAQISEAASDRRAGRVRDGP